MAHKSFANCISGVVAAGDEDGMLRKAIHKDNQELMVVVWRKWSHNVN